MIVDNSEKETDHLVLSMEEMLNLNKQESWLILHQSSQQEQQSEVLLHQREKVSECINSSVRMSFKLVNFAKTLYEMDTS